MRNEDQEKEQQDKERQQPSSVDRVNDLLDKARSVRKLRGLQKEARVGKEAAKTGGKIAARAGTTVARSAGQVAAATSEVWVPILIIGAIIFLIIVVIVIIFGGSSTSDSVDSGCEGISVSSSTASPTNPATLTAVNCEGVPTPLTYVWTTSDTAGTLSSPTSETTTYTPSSTTIEDVTIALVICNETDPQNCSSPYTTIINGSALSSCPFDYTQYPAQCLKLVFNVVVNTELSISRLVTIYKIFASTNSETYRSLLTKGGNVLEIDVPYCTSGCISLTSANHIKLNGFFSLGLSYNSQRYLLLHESGHVISRRNSQLSNSFSNTLLASQDGTACYQYNSTYCTGSFRGGHFVRSYSLRYYCDGDCWTGISAHNEAFAEAIANYAVGSRSTSYYRCSIPILDVKSQCPNTSAWIRTNVYGGVVL